MLELADRMLGSHYHKSVCHKLEGRGLLFLLLGALLLAACATVEAPAQPEAIVLGMCTTDGNCGTSRRDLARSVYARSSCYQVRSAEAG